MTGVTTNVILSGIRFYQSCYLFLNLSENSMLTHTACLLFSCKGNSHDTNMRNSLINEYSGFFPPQDGKWWAVENTVMSRARILMT
jgi:ribonucleotide reductase beta subunit family protein with ferritin-like domain